MSSPDVDTADRRSVIGVNAVGGDRSVTDRRAELTEVRVADLMAVREAFDRLGELLDRATRRLNQHDLEAAHAVRLEAWVVAESLPAAFRMER